MDKDELDHLEILRIHQKWRTGKDERLFVDLPYTAAQLTKAFDTCINEIEHHRIEARNMDKPNYPDRHYPAEICLECGNKHGKPRHSHDIGVWQGRCGWCGKEGTVTHPRDFRYPEWKP